MMRVSSLVIAAILSGCYATAGDGRHHGGGGSAEFRLSLPAELPPLVVVQPGISVARDMDDEIFYADGYYWARQDRYWYRTRDHRGSWEQVDDRHVPGPIAQSPPGRYRHYQGDERGRNAREANESFNR